MEPQEPRFPRQAPAPRRLLQLIVALIGWVIFVYWWWIVFQRVSRQEVVFTVWFISVTTLIMIVLTALWSMHNKRLHRRKAPRNKARAVREDYSLDTLSRNVTFLGGVEGARKDRLVRIQIVAGGKTYRSSSGPAAGKPARG